MNQLRPTVTDARLLAENYRYGLIRFGRGDRILRPGSIMERVENRCDARIVLDRSRALPNRHMGRCQLEIPGEKLLHG